MTAFFWVRVKNSFSFKEWAVAGKVQKMVRFKKLSCSIFCPVSVCWERSGIKWISDWNNLKGWTSWDHWGSVTSSNWLAHMATFYGSANWWQLLPPLLHTFEPNGSFCPIEALSLPSPSPLSKPMKTQPHLSLFCPAIGCQHLYSPIRSNFGAGSQGQHLALQQTVKDKTSREKTLLKQIYLVAFI